jgi:hypothetical protein
MRQQSLFAIREIPKGLIFKSDFLTFQEERDLLALLQTLPFDEFKLHGVAAKRRVLHFGLRYALDSSIKGKVKKKYFTVAGCFLAFQPT